MFSDSDPRDIVNAKIKEDEDLGEKVGGSGHLGFITYEIDKICKPEGVKTQKGQAWEITYVYTIIVETEFTHYPDNPPYERKYKKTIIVDDKGNIIRESQKEEIGKPR